MKATVTALLLMLLSGAPQDRGRVESIERQRLEAVRLNDIQALERILADDWIMTSATGERLTKRQYLDQLKSGERKYDSLEHEDLALVVHEPAAIITGRTRAVWHDRSGDHRTAGTFTHVYLHERGTWIMLAAHVSGAQ